MRYHDGLHREPMLFNNGDNAFDLVARIDYDGFSRLLVSENRAVALQQTHRKNFVNHLHLLYTYMTRIVDVDKYYVTRHISAFVPPDLSRKTQATFVPIVYSEWTEIFGTDTVRFKRVAYAGVGRILGCGPHFLLSKNACPPHYRAWSWINVLQSYRGERRLAISDARPGKAPA